MMARKKKVEKICAVQPLSASVLNTHTIQNCSCPLALE